MYCFASRTLLSLSEVGGGAGKTTLVRQVAQLCGRKLVEVALTGGTDTSDLLGSFEQVDLQRYLQVCPLCAHVFI